MNLVISSHLYYSVNGDENEDFIGMYEIIKPFGKELCVSEAAILMKNHFTSKLLLLMARMMKAVI